MAEFRNQEQDRKLFRMIALVLALLPGYVAVLPVSGFAAELIVVTQSGCVWCARWRSEIAPIYPKTDEGRLAPIREVSLDDGWPEDLSNIAQERVTPSFILIDEGKEIGRLRGYSGDQFYWFLLGELFEKIR